jgi:hypothetical protein
VLLAVREAPGLAVQGPEQGRRRDRTILVVHLREERVDLRCALTARSLHVKLPILKRNVARG